MPPKRNMPTTGAQSTTSSTLSSGPQTLTANSSTLQIIQHIWHQYSTSTPQRTLLLDGFLGFLAIVAVIQFVYCVLAGNFPFNAFLSGFCAAVGQFVLTVSLRMQTSGPGSKPSSKGKNARFESEGSVSGITGSGVEGISHERAFADYIFGSLVLHFFCINFIN